MSNAKANIHKRNPERDFDLIEKIGSGTYGEVYKARVKATGEMAAVKIIGIEPGDDFDIIQQEIVLMEGCKHPNIVCYLGSYMRRDKLWIAMEFCGGGSLQDIYHVTGPLNESQIGAVSTEMLKGLGYLHNNGKIHRDIKGANILLTNEGDVKLADFGVSAQITATINKRNSFIGTPYWMAPEVAAVERTGGYDFQCDVWAVGITAIELAELQPPLFDLHPMRALYLISKKNYTPPNVKDKNKWSTEMRDFIKLALTKNPKKRPNAEKLLTHPFCSARHVRKLLQELLSKHANIAGKEPYKFYDDDDEEEEEPSKEVERDDGTVKRVIANKRDARGNGSQKHDDVEAHPVSGGKVYDNRVSNPGTFVVKDSSAESSSEGETIKRFREHGISTSNPPPIPPREATVKRQPNADPSRSDRSSDDGLSSSPTHGGKAPPPLPPRKAGLTATRPQAVTSRAQANCFSKIFNECPLRVSCASSWTHPEKKSHHLLFASDEGIYSLNLDDLQNVEMLQIYPRPCSWIYLIKNIMVSMSGSPPCVFMHNLISLHAKQASQPVLPLSRGIAYTSKIPGTIGVRKCRVVHNPYNNQVYLFAAMVDSILLLQWYEPLQRFMTVRNFELRLPSPLGLFEAIVVTNAEFPLLCLGVREGPNNSLIFDTVNLESTAEWQSKPGVRYLNVKSFSQLETDLILVSYEKRVVFVDVEGRQKVIRGHVTGIDFDMDIENTVCLRGSVLTFHKHGIQGKSLVDSQVTAQFTDNSRIYRLLGSDRIVVMESRLASEPSSANLYILASS